MSKKFSITFDDIYLYDGKFQFVCLSYKSQKKYIVLRSFPSSHYRTNRPERCGPINRKKVEKDKVRLTLIIIQSLVELTTK